jgi:carbamoyl-phosphate synthase large subunit
MMRKLGIPQPESGMASTLEQAIGVAKQIGYPLIVRPSYVLGGRAMEVVHDEEMLREYVAKAVEISPERPIYVDRFLQNALEAEADAICDGTDAFVPAVMEHIELAGVHSGDSACVIPPVNIPQRHLDTIEAYTKRIALELGVIGLINIQFAIENDKVFILEANPRASRTVPIVSKVCNIPMARIAAQVMLGRRLRDLGVSRRPVPHFGVKESVFPFYMFPEVDPVLGPEMRSTGEVLGMARSPGLAFFKAQQATKSALPTRGTVLITVAERDRAGILDAARRFAKLGFQIRATKGTHAFLASNGVKAEPVLKIHEGRPNLADAIKNGEIHLLVNTPAGKASAQDDSYIRKAAIRHRVPYITTATGATAASLGIEARLAGTEEVRSLQAYHAEIG